MSALAFADPVFESQTAFRAILRAMSSPGEIVVCGAELAPPASLSRAAAAALLTLADFETNLWIAPAFPQRDEIAAYLKFHTGAALVASPDEAAFALIDATSQTLDLSRFARGTPEYPDRSTTLIVEVAALSNAPLLTLAGPGVKGESHLDAAPLPPDFVEQWQANHAAFPRSESISYWSPATNSRLCRVRFA